MSYEDLLVASGVRRFPGKTGRVYLRKGEIIIGKAPLKGIDSHLFGVLKIAVDKLECGIWITSIDTGRHAPNSRHYQGRAADIGLVGPRDSDLRKATLHNPLAVAFAQWLLDHGFYVGEGAKSVRGKRRAMPGLLFGPNRTRWNPTTVPHDTHIHASLPRHY